jgi:uncharacterized secreted repeat protein (TIGR03808 family)
MTFDRRSLIGAGLGLGATTTLAAAKAAEPARANSAYSARLKAGSSDDQSAALQAAIDMAAAKEAPLLLPHGTFVVSGIKLRRGTRLVGASGATTLKFGGGAAFIFGENADELVVSDLVLDGDGKAFDDASGEGLMTLAQSANIRVANILIRNSHRSGLSLVGCSGQVTGSRIEGAADAGFKSLDGKGLEISGNTVRGCGNNGILIWQSEQREDGSVVSGNRIANIRNDAGGTGQYGNGINVFRAASVIVSNNRISDCTYTAVRGNAASNIQIIGNSCERLGEVALYSEFGFEGALIANNLVDTAATGISVTNFKEGGRLAVVQGNLIRNLFRREHEPEDKRGEGIGVEADAVVSGNTIENAPTVGIQIGWGAYMRDVAVTGNVIRQSRVGISITSAPEAGQCLVANNLIANCSDGAIRGMHFGAPQGPDLAKAPSEARNILVSGNMSS